MANRDHRSSRANNSRDQSLSSGSITAARVFQRKRRFNAVPPVAAPTAGIFSGVPGTWICKDNEFLCPVCFDTFKEAHMTKCGHSFCHQCIIRCLEQNPRCPKCNCHLDLTQNSILFPNFALDELVAKSKQKKQDLKSQWSKSCKKSPPNFTNELEQVIQMASSGSNVDMRDIEDMIRVLTEKRDEMESESFLTQHTLLSEFLTHLKRLKDDQLMQLKKECDVIQNDLSSVQSILQNLSIERKSDPAPAEEDQVPMPLDPKPSTSRGTDSMSVVPTDDKSEGFNVFRNKSSVFKSTLPQRRKRMNEHFEDLASCYFSCKSAEVAFPPIPDFSEPSASSETAPPKVVNRGLEQFSSCLSSFTRYSMLHPLATLNYATDIFNTASIVSSIEFDKDNEMFAIAGVTKRIKVYDYDVILKDMVDIHYPCIEMVCGSKISCISWNTFHKSTLASSDYDCSVIVWDANTAQRVKTFQEHEKRCWSVDFNSVDTKLLASGSDDSRVKLWSANMNHSVASLEAKANVCCVKFNPTSCYHLAFGSADHCVHYYDLRNSKLPLNVFRGHKKAVSYVKFLNATDLVSASTDSQLKLWNVNQKNCMRSFTGHVNEKNFVGLATDGDYITCGSENNGLYVYYRGLSRPLFHFKFDPARTLLDRDPPARKEDDNMSDFVSAVCWRQGSPVVVAANSQGTIKVLELV